MTHKVTNHESDSNHQLAEGEHEDRTLGVLEAVGFDEEREEGEGGEHAARDAPERHPVGDKSLVVSKG